MRVELDPWRGPERGPAIAALIAIGLLALWMAVDGDGYLRILDDANLAFRTLGWLLVLGAAAWLAWRWWSAERAGRVPDIAGA